MLVKFEVQNFRSFHTKKVFHTVQRNFRRFTQHVYKYSDNLSILKTSGIYGGNASGKTNLFKALYFVKRMVQVPGFINTSESSKVFSPFKLNKGSISRESIFNVEFISEDRLYSYELEVHKKTKKILFEQLKRIDLQNEEFVIFTRKIKEDGEEFFEYPPDSKVEKLYALVIKNLTQNNSTFLSIGITNEQDYSNARNWFLDKLEFLFPVYKFKDIAYTLSLKKDYLELANKIIKFSKTGIDKLKIERIPIEIFLGKSFDDIISTIETSLERRPFYSFENPNGHEECTAIKSEDGNIIVLKLVAIHLDNEKEEVSFNLDEESRGTEVLINLLPALILSYGEGVNYFIDEINASLHPILLKEILSQYLEHNIGLAKGQLIFNSHEDFIMDEKIIRQDELWLTEKNENGETDIFPLSDIPNVRFDLNLKKNYLNGKFGGVPFDEKPDKLLFNVKF